MSVTTPEKGVTSLVLTADEPFVWDADRGRKQQLLLLSLFVAGKNAKIQGGKMRDFLALLPPAETAFDSLEQLDAAAIRQRLERVRSGQYNRLTAALHHLRQLPDVDEVTRDQLCTVPGVSLKSASFFLMYSREDYRGACWDVHLLKWAAERPALFGDGVPKNTPSRPRYLSMERAYLDYCEAGRFHPTHLDFSIWSSYRRS